MISILRMAAEAIHFGCCGDLDSVRIRYGLSVCGQLRHGAMSAAGAANREGFTGIVVEKMSGTI